MKFDRGSVIFGLAVLSLSQAAQADQREFRYVNGACVNAQGQTGHNPVSTIRVSPAVQKFIDLKFGFAPGEYQYFEFVDAECVDLSSINDFAAEMLHPAGSKRIWIQNLNFRGVEAQNLSFNDFDTPRAQLEGAHLTSSIRVYSSIAATLDEYTLFNGKRAICRDIKLKKGIWPDEIVDPNNAFCSTNTW